MPIQKLLERNKVDTMQNVEQILESFKDFREEYLSQNNETVEMIDFLTSMMTYGVTQFFHPTPKAPSSPILVELEKISAPITHKTTGKIYRKAGDDAAGRSSKEEQPVILASLVSESGAKIECSFGRSLEAKRGEDAMIGTGVIIDTDAIIETEHDNVCENLTVLTAHRVHSQLTEFTHSSHCSHIVLTLFSHCSHTVLTLFSHCSHIHSHESDVLLTVVLLTHCQWSN